MTKVIGIDVSKQTLDVHIQGKSYKLSNQRSGFEKLITHDPDHIAWFVMEATGPYYLNLAYYLEQRGHRVAVINPLVIRRFGQMRLLRAKTDKKDAGLIADYGHQCALQVWHPAEPVLAELQQLQSVLEGQMRMQTQLNNQLEALQQHYAPSQTAKESLLYLLSELKKQILLLEAQCVTLAMKHYGATMNLLCSIPGIGKKTAIALLVITHNFTRFESCKKLASYVGICPRVYESGTSVRGRGGICKMGMGRIRKLLYLCSWTAKRFNKHCQVMYERLRLKGKPERVIKIAIANKLLRQAFAVVKSQTAYKIMG